MWLSEASFFLASENCLKTIHVGRIPIVLIYSHSHRFQLGTYQSCLSRQFHVDVPNATWSSAAKSSFKFYRRLATLSNAQEQVEEEGFHESISVFLLKGLKYVVEAGL